ncbi:MAG: prepilin-type N-terminal cleavage/methylation domain-containing protein [Bacilli bacterium]|nr:prepilin-type N-terminal cleavage/methylation domain-containing protein [Bacilli bacterium]
MKNNKGYTLIEILGTITIISILSIVAVGAYTKYLESARQKAYDTLAKSASHAASEYVMDHVGIDSVTLEELTEGDYLETPTDPGSKGSICDGKVDIIYQTNSNALDTEEYDVTICCTNYRYRYHFPGGDKHVTTCPTE